MQETPMRKTGLASSNVSLYIGKVEKCPKCKQKGYLILTKSCFRIKHYIGRYPNSRSVKYRYCNITTMQRILHRYRRKYQPDYHKRK